MTDEQIKALWAMLQERLDDLLIMTAALQTLLQEVGIVTPESVEARKQLIRRLYSAGMEDLAKDLQEKETEERRARLLASYKGPKQ